MKAALTAFLLLATGAGPALAGVIGLERIAIAGADYVRLGEWADSNGFEMVWRKKSDPIELTNPSASLRFATDSRNSRKAQICGATVLLSLPVVNRSGTALISVTDVEKTLQPVLFPPRSRTRVQTICLDPGHGGKDKGEIDGDNYEKKYTLLLGAATEKLLHQAGFKVALTRTNDEYVELADRAALASRAGADLFVSLHYNSGPKGVRGVEVHCMPPAGIKSSNAGGGRGNEPAYAGNSADDRNILLAYEILKSVTTTLPVEVIGVKRSHYEVLREARVPAILIEGGFMTDRRDAEQIYDSAFRQRMARAIVTGILAYKKAVEETEIGSIKSPGHGSPAPGRD